MGLLEKPEKYRKKVMWITASLFMALVIIIWLFSLGSLKLSSPELEQLGDDIKDTIQDNQPELEFHLPLEENGN